MDGHVDDIQWNGTLNTNYSSPEHRPGPGNLSRSLQTFLGEGLEDVGAVGPTPYDRLLDMKDSSRMATQRPTWGVFGPTTPQNLHGYGTASFAPKMDPTTPMSSLNTEFNLLNRSSLPNTPVVLAGCSYVPDKNRCGGKREDDERGESSKNSLGDMACGASGRSAPVRHATSWMYPENRDEGFVQNAGSRFQPLLNIHQQFDNYLEKLPADAEARPREDGQRFRQSGEFWNSGAQCDVEQMEKIPMEPLLPWYSVFDQHQNEKTAAVSWEQRNQGLSSKHNGNTIQSLFPDVNPHPSEPYSDANFRMTDENAKPVASAPYPMRQPNSPRSDIKSFTFQNFQSVIDGNICNAGILTPEEKCLNSDVELEKLTNDLHRIMNGLDPQLINEISANADLTDDSGQSSLSSANMIGSDLKPVEPAMLNGNDPLLTSSSMCDEGNDELQARTIVTCPTCSTLVGTNDFANHMQTHKDSADFTPSEPHSTNPEQLYLCSVCPYRSHVMSELLKHLQIHKIDTSAGTNLICGQCQQSFKKHDQLVEHIAQHSLQRRSDGHQSQPAAATGLCGQVDNTMFCVDKPIAPTAFWNCFKQIPSGAGAPNFADRSPGMNGTLPGMNNSVTNQMFQTMAMDNRQSANKTYIRCPFCNRQLASLSPLQEMINVQCSCCKNVFLFKPHSPLTPSQAIAPHSVLRNPVPGLANSAIYPTPASTMQSSAMNYLCGKCSKVFPGLEVAQQHTCQMIQANLPSSDGSDLVNATSREAPKYPPSFSKLKTGTVAHKPLTSSRIRNVVWNTLKELVTGPNGQFIQSVITYKETSCEPSHDTSSLYVSVNGTPKKAVPCIKPFELDLSQDFPLLALANDDTLTDVSNQAAELTPDCVVPSSLMSPAPSHEELNKSAIFVQSDSKGSAASTRPVDSLNIPSEVFPEKVPGLNTFENLFNYIHPTFPANVKGSSNTSVTWSASQSVCTTPSVQPDSEIAITVSLKDEEPIPSSGASNGNISFLQVAQEETKEVKDVKEEWSFQISDGMEICDQCGAICEDFNDLLLHMENHHDCAIIQCTFCSERTLSEGAMRSHVAAVHPDQLDLKEEPEPQPKNRKLRKPLFCKQCNLSFTAEMQWLAHLTREHSLGNISSLSPVDDASLPDKPADDDDDDPLLYPFTGNTDTKLRCPVCDFSTSDPSEMDRHRHNDRIIFRHICGKCGLCFDADEEISRHFCSRDSDKAFSCFICSCECKDVKELKNHITNHFAYVQKVSESTAETEERQDRAVVTINEKYYQISRSEIVITENGDLITKLTECSPRLHPCSHCHQVFEEEKTFGKHVCVVANGSVYFCCRCEFTAVDVLEIKLHYVREHAPQLMKNCFHCDEKFLRRGDLWEHAREAHADLCQLPCSHCTFKAYCMPHLKKHASTEHNILEYGDSAEARSNSYLPTDDDLEMYLLTHDADIPLVCSFCPFKTCEMSLFREHERRNHLHSCDTCSYQFSDFILFMHHICQTDFQKNPSFSCHECPFTTDNGDELKSHLCEHPIQDEVLDRVPPESENISNRNETVASADFKCNVCQSTFASREELHVHVQSHNAIARFTCYKCTRKFRLRCQLVIHLRSHVGEKAFPCAMCQRWFKTRCARDQHVLTHTKTTTPPARQCRFCGLPFQSREKCTEHELMDSCISLKRKSSVRDEITLPLKYWGNNSLCSFCPRVFNDDKEREAHCCQEHPNDMKSCAHCNAMFVTKIQLRAHIQENHQQKMYVCDQCGRSYNAYTSLYLHTQKAHSNLFMCDKCGLKCTTSMGLARHTRKHTGQKRYQCQKCGLHFHMVSNLK